MYIHNVTFMILPGREKELLGWLSGRLDSIVVPPAVNPRVSTMREAGGVSCRDAEAQSVAFQLEFPTFDEARRWGAEVLPEVSGEFVRCFGPDAMTFASIFEEMPLG